MTQNDIETILNFLVAKLPEDQLAELDALREGGSKNQPAMDAALGDTPRRDYLALPPSARNSLRRAARGRMAHDEDVTRAYADRFPNSDRLTIG